MEEEKEDEFEEDNDDETEDNLIYIDAVGKDIKIKEDIPVMNLSSYAREYQSMEIIKSSFDILQEQIEFLKDEIREKNLLIKILNFRNANDGDKINIEQVEDSQLSLHTETTSTINHNILLDVSSDTDHYNSGGDQKTDSYIISDYENKTNSIHRNLVGYDETLTDNLSEISSAQIHAYSDTT